MFQRERYVTRGIANDIPREIQVFLWSLIDGMIQKCQAMDYLQIFDLFPANNDGEGQVQTVIHSQEEPEYEREYAVATDNPVTAKIFVIDTMTHCTMLLAGEY